MTIREFFDYVIEQRLPGDTRMTIVVSRRQVDEDDYIVPVNNLYPVNEDRILVVSGSIIRRGRLWSDTVDATNAAQQAEERQEALLTDEEDSLDDDYYYGEDEFDPEEPLDP